MSHHIQLLDVVALTEDLPGQALWRGQVGTVVEILKDGAAYEVEFCDREGRTYASLGLRPMMWSDKNGHVVKRLFAY